MSYYRVALAFAHCGNLTAAARLAQCSLALNEGAPNALRLLELIQKYSSIDSKTRAALRELTESHKYSKALKLPLNGSPNALTARGLLYAQIGRKGAAREQFTLALAMDSGNKTARRALNCL